MKLTVCDISNMRDANESWGFNCGPAALCAVTGLTPDQVRPHLGDFESKRYTNPSLMAESLRSLRLPFREVFKEKPAHTLSGWVDANAPGVVYPRFGLVRIQWAGPWTQPGVPIRVRYRRTHWIAVDQREKNRMVFDVNCGLVAWKDWVDSVVPWILEQCVPKATGEFWPTHCWEVNNEPF